MNNNDLSYSTNALNIKNLFYRKDVSVYVEGKEDILFWDVMFKASTTVNVHIEDSDGSENLKDYMDRIINEDAQIIVACDSDHTPFLMENKYNNPRIVRTYGYSIENTMYCVNNINHVVKRFAKSKNDFKNEIMEWYKIFCDNCSILLYYDIANHRFTKKVQVLGDKCNRFLTSTHSSNINSASVLRHIESLKSYFSKEEIEECVSLVAKDDRELRFLIKGHFLTNGAINLIKEIVNRETGGSVSISLDSLYSLTINCISTCKSLCKDRQTVHERIGLSLLSLGFS